MTQLVMSMLSTHNFSGFGIVLILAITILVSTVFGSCIHDNIQPKSTIQHQQSYSFDKSRSKRSIESHYKPIRINSQFHDLNYELDDLSQNRLKSVISETIQKAQEIFTVLPVKGPLLLGRAFSAYCKTVWSSGPNTGKCQQDRSSYGGETCLDKFQIPSKHLEGVYLWDQNNSKPIRVISPKGAGLQDTDFVLYVQSFSSTPCISGGLNVMAYAAYCQVDQNNRPVAGYINFCPQLLNDPDYSQDKVILTALHELFHALGFSTDLFSKFQDCQLKGDEVECSNVQYEPVQKVQGAIRLVSPKVVNVTSHHFGCETHQTINQFGPILQTQNGEHKSHWDAAFLQGSIMAPTIGQPHVTKLDPVTLALFEDSGWYRINNHFTNKYFWGKDQGCNFGLNAACEASRSPYYCIGSGRGCHYLHRDKGICGSNVFLHRCQMYLPQAQDNCAAKNSIPRNYSGEIFGDHSFCYVTNITTKPCDEETPLVPSCYRSHCDSQGILHVSVDGLEPIRCPSSSTIQIPGYVGVMECPPNDVVCYRDPPPPTTTTPIPTTQRHEVINPGPLSVVCLDITFAKADYDRLMEAHEGMLFKDCVIERIQIVAEVSHRRIANIFLNRGSIVFRFDLLPVQFSDDGPPTRLVITLIQSSIFSGNFSFLLPPNGLSYMATSVSQREGGPMPVETSFDAGTIAGITLGAVVVAMVIGILVYLVQRHYALHSRIIPNRQRSARSNIPTISQNSTGSIHQVEQPHSPNRSTSSPSHLHSGNSRHNPENTHLPNHNLQHATPDLLDDVIAVDDGRDIAHSDSNWGTYPPQTGGWTSGIGGGGVATWGTENPRKAGRHSLSSQGTDSSSSDSFFSSISGNSRHSARIAPVLSVGDIRVMDIRA